MNVLTFAQTLHDLNVIKSLGHEEVILGHREFSRFGKLDDVAFRELSFRAKELGLSVIFEWDILMTEDVFTKTSNMILEFLHDFDVLRVQDPGALEWSLNHTNKPLHFIAENGNHNLKALQTWAAYAGERLNRIVLSIELTKSMLEEYLKALPVACELLGFGRILLFYTPRSLLSPLTSTKLSMNDEIAALGESEESPHKGFPIVENRYGTFMFHIKEFCLLDFSHELKSMGLRSIRIDLRWQNLNFLPIVHKMALDFNPDEFETFKTDYPQDLMRGFYLVNKTDVLFPKLKNHRLQKREGDYLGEVMEAEKASHLAILIKHPRGLKKTDRLKIIHPEGKVFEVSIYTLKNTALQDMDQISANSLALIQFVGGVWVKSQVFYHED